MTPTRLPNGRPAYICRCECGKESAIDHYALLRNHSKSCGCYKRDNPGALTHGHCRNHRDSPEWKCWQGIVERCCNPNSRNHDRYGGRGIRMCEQWRQSFEQFLADMGPRPSPKHTIDRINNDGNYEPSNCRWATRTEQVRNRSITKRLTLNGVTRTLKEWSDITGIKYQTLRNRVVNLGMTGEQALSVKAHAGKITLNAR